jgi:hypothetical protein
MDELLASARRRLAMNGIPPWRLISARRKLGKTLFEVEEETASGPRRLIGRIGPERRAGTLYAALEALWNAGFRPPSRLTVTQPVALLDERGLVLQEKAPGRQALDLILEGEHETRLAAEASADWLAALHGCAVRVAPADAHPPAISRWAGELAPLLPADADRIRRIENAVLHELRQPSPPPVPCHGDFHAMNIFVAPSGRITAIDLDKFCVREPESDVGYFLAQTAAFGFLEKASFDVTALARRTFLERYQSARGGPVHTRRVATYMAMAFLKNLHFELVLLSTGRTQYADPWIGAAASAILNGNLHLSP